MVPLKYVGNFASPLTGVNELFKIWINHKPRERFLDFLKAMKWVSSPFWTFLRPKLEKKTGRFDTNSSDEIHKYFFDKFKYSLRVNKKNFLSEYSSGVVKPSTWNYLQIKWINLYRNDFL